MSEKYFNWGIIGTGGIANAFSRDIKYLENHRISAVLSRSINTAKSFSSDKPNCTGYDDIDLNTLNQNGTVNMESYRFNHDIDSDGKYIFNGFKGLEYGNILNPGTLSNPGEPMILTLIDSNDLNNTNRASVKLPEGRGEILRLKQGMILIDFAHDQQSMQNILSELGNYYSDIILVFGCGGDRDKSKRPKMMKVAQDFSSKVFFTSDNIAPTFAAAANNSAVFADIILR